MVFFSAMILRSEHIDRINNSVSILIIACHTDAVLIIRLKTIQADFGNNNGFRYGFGLCAGIFRPLIFVRTCTEEKGGQGHENTKERGVCDKPQPLFALSVVLFDEETLLHGYSPFSSCDSDRQQFIARQTLDGKMSRSSLK